MIQFIKSFTSCLSILLLPNQLIISYQKDILVGDDMDMDIYRSCWIWYGFESSILLEDMILDSNPFFRDILIPCSGLSSWKGRIRWQIWFLRRNLKVDNKPNPSMCEARKNWQCYYGNSWDTASLKDCWHFSFLSSDRNRIMVMPPAFMRL